VLASLVEPNASSRVARLKFAGVAVLNSASPALTGMSAVQVASAPAIELPTELIPS
jgi:hypothetical protein